MEGLITAFSGTSLTVNMTYVNGVASFSNWTITNSGAVGTSGYSGYSGAVGTSGFSGYSGISGYSGYSGYSGSGISGYSGSGISGYSGYSGSGISGYSGSGISGYSGFSGISGYSGFSGISGYSGFSGTPAGSTGQIQYNNAGSFGASANLFWDNTNKRLGIGTSSPSQVLQATTSGDTSALISTSSSTAGNSARVDLTTGVKSFALQNYNSDGTAGNSAFRLFDNTRTVEDWRVDNSGNFLVGTTSSPTGAGTTPAIVSVGAVYAGNGANGGFYTSTYGVNVPNNIWAFGNAANYGLKYFQGTAGSSTNGGGYADSIALPFGQTTSNASFFQFICNGSSLSALIQKNQPAFRASLTNSGDQTLTNTVLAFNVKTFDKSGNFDTGTYSFTAPVAGTYFFYVQTYGTSSAGAATMQNLFQVNGTNVSPANGDIYIGGSAGQINIAPIQTSMTINLSAGDTVRVYAGAYYSSAVYRIYTGASIFTGWLIG